MNIQGREGQMRRLLERREREGLTYRQAAALEPGVSINMLFWWRRRLTRRSSAAPAVERTSPAGFVELASARPALPASHIEIVLERGRRVVVDAEVDESALQRVVRALEGC
jgi:hypothetical protein